MKTDFSKFKIGSVFNHVQLARDIKREHNKVRVLYPSRLEAMALDPSKIADNNNLIYEAGQIDVCVALYKTVTISINSSHQGIILSERTPRKSLVLHAALIMKSALRIDDGLDIDVKDTVNLRHCGLGSSSSLIAATAAAINELYGKPIDAQDLVRYCAQNHGEEIDSDDEYLVPVQCIGGSGVCGHYEGGLIVLAGQATPIFQHNLPDDLKVVIGIPEDFVHPDSSELMAAEVDNIDNFKSTGEEYGQRIAYRLVHEVLPGLASNDLAACKRLIFDYRWDMGSIRNCSFVYPRMVDIAEALRPLKSDEDIRLIALSSVGPGFFALTANPEKIHRIFKELRMRSYETKIHNGKYILRSIGRTV